MAHREVEVAALWQTIVMFMSMTTQIVSGISLKSLVDKLLPLMISVQLTTIVEKRNCYLDRERAILPPSEQHTM